MRTRLIACLATAGLALSAMPSFAGPLPTLYDVAETCNVRESSNTLIVNATTDPTMLAEPDDGRTVDIDVLVLLDGVTQARAEEIYAEAALPYAEIGVDVVPTYQAVSPGFLNTDAMQLMIEARETFPDRKVPAAYDMVEILTSKDITYGTGPTASLAAGLAYCLGGAHSPSFAFEVSEAADHGGGSSPQSVPSGPKPPVLGLGTNRAAKITAHEMGHLFGGQHELASCGEGVSSPAIARDDGPCTLMFYEVSLINLHFGTVNGRVVRGFALRYASANDA